MIIKINTKTQIMWIIVALYLLKTYVLEPELFFLFCLFVIGLYIIRRQSINIPRIPGFIFYVLILVIATVIGMTKYPISLIERDVFYEFFSVIYIFIGYYSFDYYRDRDKSLWKTACLILFITSGICIAQGITSVTSGADFATFREKFGQSIGSISFVLPILIGKRYIYKEDTFSKLRDNGLIILWLIQILLNLSRISIINVIVGMVIFIACSIYKGKLNLKNSFRIVSVILLLILVCNVFINIMPSEARDRFSEKFTNSLSEISADNEYNSIGDAQSDWRGYEIQCAQDQWKDNNILTQIFGEGNGTLIRIYYVPDQWIDTVENQNGGVGVTVLHNTYYTLLIKGGVLAVIALLAFILLNIIKALKTLSVFKDENVVYAIMMIVLAVQILVDAYVIRNMMDKGSEMIALLLIGWINAQINNASIENVGKNNGYINEKI